MVGLELSKQLLSAGHQLVVLTRNKENFLSRFSYPCSVFAWDFAGPPPQQAFAGVGAVIHLAGDPLAAGRWSRQKKEQMIAVLETWLSNIQARYGETEETSERVTD